MKKQYLKVIIPVLIVVGLVCFPLASADAQIIGKLLGANSVGEFVLNIMAGMVNILLQVASWWLIIAGVILNVSITVTLHIRDFVDNTPGVYLVWQTIRDISGMGFIFILLYSSFRIILSQDAKINNLIKDIIIFGILINFSFFLTGLMIDASNMVSLALYKAIAPGEKALVSRNINDITKDTFTDGGLSDIFLNSLKIQKIYSPEHMDLKNTVSTIGVPVKILLLGTVGIIMMFVAGLSFIVAAGAFMVRFVILIFLLAFSPIWFVAKILPGTEKLGNDWWGMLTSQLIFMPVYLLLMYAALLIMTNSEMLGNANAGLWKGADPGAWVPIDFIVLAVNYALVIILLNVPLLAAIKIGGVATGWINMKKVGGGAIWGWAGKRLGGAVATNTVGKWSANLDKRWSNTKFGNSAFGRDLRSSTVGSWAGAKMGASRSYVDNQKLQKEIDSKQRQIGRRASLEEHFTSGNTPEIKNVMGKMSEKEKLALGKDKLKDPKVLRNLKKSDFDAIKKAVESGDMSEVDAEEIMVARKKTLEDAINNNDSSTVEDMMKNYDGAELLSINPSFLNWDIVVRNYTVGQLKTLGDNTKNNNIKAAIARKAETLFNQGEKVASYGWLKKQDWI